MRTATRLAEQTWPEVDRRAVLAVPLGSTEQHGPHLPLSTDTDIAVALVDRLVAARPAVVAGPALAYGASGEHQDFAGTLSIGLEAVELVLVELGRSADRTFVRLLFVNAHGGNAVAVGRAVDRLRYEGRDVRAFSPAWPGDAHAGRTETSVQLALDAERVRTDRAAAGNPRPLAELISAVRAGSVAAVSPNGVLGDPAGATAAEGSRLLDAATDQLVALVDTWPTRDDHADGPPMTGPSA